MPQQIHFFGNGDNPSAIASDGNYLFIASNFGEHVIYSLANPTNPAPISVIGVGGAASDVYVDGQYAYVSAGFFVRIIDVSDPNNQDLLGTYGLSAYMGEVIGLGGLAFVAHGQAGLRLLDVSDPTNPDELSDFGFLWYGSSVESSDELLFVAGFRTGIHIMDKSDPSQPIPIGQYAATPVDMRLQGSDLYYLTPFGLWSLDVSVPSSPSLMSGPVSLPGTGRALVINDDYAYIANSAAGLVIASIVSPTNLQQIGQVDTPGFASDVALTTDYAFVADGSTGIQIIDITVPTTPTLVAAIPFVEIVQTVAVANHYLYLYEDFTGLHISDISNPLAPVPVGFLPISDSFGADILVQGSALYLALGQQGTLLIDIADPAAPQLLATQPTYNLTQDLSLHNNYLYAADGNGGLLIMGTKSLFFEPVFLPIILHP